MNVSVFSLVPDLLFDCSRVLEDAKIRTVLQSIVQSYFDTLLRYVLSVTFCVAVVMKVMDQETLVKRR